MWKKEKLLATSNYSFSQCFQPIWITFCHFHQIWNCRLQTLSVWKRLKFVLWERVKLLSILVCKSFDFQEVNDFVLFWRVKKKARLPIKVQFIFDSFSDGITIFLEWVQSRLNGLCDCLLNLLTHLFYLVSTARSLENIISKLVGCIGV